MNVQDAIDFDFRILDAAWTRERALEIIDRSSALSYIVRRVVDPLVETQYYVLDGTQVRAELQRSRAASVDAALRLSFKSRTATVDWYAALSQTNERQVVLRDGLPVGIVLPLDATRGVLLGAESRAERGAPCAVDDDLTTRLLEAQWPETVEVDSTFALLVWLTTEARSAASAASSLRLMPGSRLQVVVQPLAGVTLEGTNAGTLLVGTPQDETPVMFRFKAGAAGSGRVRLYAYDGSYSVTSMDVRLTILERGRPASAAGERRGIQATISAEPRRQPDLSLLITETGSEIVIRLNSADRSFDGTTYPAVQLATSSQDYFADFCRRIENLPVATLGQRTAAERKLAVWGVDMIEKLLPGELRATLWNLRGRIGSMQITSDEAWIPWEVCRLSSIDDSGSKVEGPFLAEEFAITRWLHGVASRPRFGFGEWALVVPKESRLPNAPREESFIHSLAGPDRKVTQVPASFCELTAAMESERYQAWHFCGHAHAGGGGGGDQAAIELDDRDSMTADMFSGTVENALRTGPFIFLNACQSAQGGLTLTGVGGWARRFIKPTASRFAASAFIGSYWSVYDEAALAFTKELYKSLIDERKAIGTAVKDARSAVRTSDDPLTWLAYTVYADPLATMESR